MSFLWAFDVLMLELCNITRNFYSEANRRWSMALSSMGHSQTSAQSLQSIAGGDPGEFFFPFIEIKNQIAN